MNDGKITRREAIGTAVAAVAGVAALGAGGEPDVISGHFSTGPLAGCEWAVVDHRSPRQSRGPLESVTTFEHEGGWTIETTRTTGELVCKDALFGPSVYQRVYPTGQRPRDLTRDEFMTLLKGGTDG